MNFERLSSGSVERSANVYSSVKMQIFFHILCIFDRQCYYPRFNGDLNTLTAAIDNTKLHIRYSIKKKTNHNLSAFIRPFFLLIYL